MGLPISAAAAHETAMGQRIYFAACATLGAELSAVMMRCLSRYGHVTAASTLAGPSERLGCLAEADVLVADVGGVGGGDASGAELGAELAYALHRRRIPTVCVWHSSAGASAECPFASARAWAAEGEPLLQLAPYSDTSDLETVLASALAPPAAPGRIFVIEGGDGAGKQTQAAMLLDRLRAHGYPARTLDFPHDAARHGQLIRELLAGKHGSIGEVNPLLFASLYAENRHDVAPVLRHWLARGTNVVLDRYTEANFGHQASKLDEPSGAREALVEQLAKFECEWLGLPRSHAVLYLDLPPADAEASMRADGSRAKLDMHETAGQRCARRRRCRARAPEVRGRPRGDARWRVGVRPPFDARALLAMRADAPWRPPTPGPQLQAGRARHLPAVCLQVCALDARAVRRQRAPPLAGGALRPDLGDALASLRQQGALSVAASDTLPAQLSHLRSRP